MRLVIDTETNGAQPDFDSAADAAHQPRLVQLAAILENEQQEEVASMNLIVKPVGFEINLINEHFHGVSQTMAENYGVAARDVLGVFLSLARRATEFVGYGLNNDALVIEGELRRQMIPPFFPGQRMVCVERMVRPILNVRNGRRELKQHTLVSAYAYAFCGQTYDKPHRPMADAKAASRLRTWAVEEAERLKATGRTGWRRYHHEAHEPAALDQYEDRKKISEGMAG